MKKIFWQIVLVALTLLCFGNVSAKPMYCHYGWGGGDNGYDDSSQVVISDKPIRSVRPRFEGDAGYEVRKGSQSATLSLSVGGGNKWYYGNNVVLDYRADNKTTKPSFLKANYMFARECMKKIHKYTEKDLKKASLNPKEKSRK